MADKRSMSSMLQLREVLVKLTPKLLGMRRIVHIAHRLTRFLVNSCPLRFYWRSGLGFSLGCLCSPPA
jgi:hypothetical protein